MTPEEIMRALRWLGEETEFIFAAENLNGAADLIESLQAQLAESQRRERAAVELIGKVSQAVEVAFNATDYVKPNTGIWHTLGLALDWIKAWRGPQDSGKGDGPCIKHRES